MRFVTLVVVAGAVLVAGAVPGASLAQQVPSYGEHLRLLQKHTEVIELTAGQARVIVCPRLQGRVMTATASGLQGTSNGWVNPAALQAGEVNRQFNNYGGSDRFWLAPEAGQFGLFFAPGAKLTFANWFTPPALNQGAFQVLGRSSREVRMGRQMRLQNASRQQFHIYVNRTVRLLSRWRLLQTLGPQAAAAMEQGGLRAVAYETENTITNLGPDWSLERGLLSIWILGMFPPGPETAILVPYRPGPESELGPVVISDYFGPLGPDRLKVLPSVILFRGDGRYRSKIGVTQKRVRPVAGAIDFRRGVLTLVQFSLPRQPEKHLYVNNLWHLPQKEPYVGDVFNSYNDGPTEPGASSLGGFFELETLSRTRPLRTGESLTHVHRTFHIEGSPEQLSRITQAVLGVDLQTVRRAFFSQ